MAGFSDENGQSKDDLRFNARFKITGDEVEQFACMESSLLSEHITRKSKASNTICFFEALKLKRRDLALPLCISHYV